MTLSDKFGIFVGDIPLEFTNQDLKNLFESKWPNDIVDARVVINPENQVSKLYGFVTFSSKPSALDSIEEWHQQYIIGPPYTKEWQDKPIRLGWADRSVLIMIFDKPTLRTRSIGIQKNAFR